MAFPRIVVYFFFICITSALILAGTVYYYRLQLLEGIVRSVLTSDRIKYEQLIIKDFGYKHVTVDRLAVCFGAVVSEKHCIKTGKTLIALRWPGLFTPKVTTLTISDFVYEPPVSSEVQEPVRIEPYLRYLPLTQYLNWADKIQATFRVEPGVSSALPAVTGDFTSTCKVAGCNYSISVSKPDSDYLLHASGEEVVTADTRTGNFVFTDRAKESELGLVEYTSESKGVALQVKVVLQSALFDGFIPELNTTTGTLTGVLEIPADAGDETPHSLSITIADTSIKGVTITSADLTGTVTDSLTTDLSGTVSISGIETPVAVKKLKVTPAGDVAVSVAVSVKVPELPVQYRSFFAGAQPVTFSNGQIVGDGSFQITAAGLAATIKADVRNIDGMLGAVLFTGLNGGVQLEKTPLRIHSKPSTFTVHSIASGVTLVENKIVLDGVTIDYSDSGAVLDYAVRLKQASGVFFDGTYTIGSLVVTSASTETLVPIALHKLSLKNLSNLYGREMIFATGIVDGSIPVRLNTEKGIYVDAGTLQAREPGGVLQLGPSLVDKLAGTPGMETASRALQDYRYSKLSASVTYEPEGTLGLGFSLEGSSPALNTTRPVHVNLNVEQNLLNLLKSLRMVQGIESSIRLPRK